MSAEGAREGLDRAFVISEALEVNSIVWLRSLPEEELGPTRRIIEDLEPLSRASGHSFLEFAVHDRRDLAKAFADVSMLAAQGLRPILHIDAHGSADSGLLLASGEKVPWADVIDGLRNINVATHNNLVCVMALCYGLHLYKEVSLNKPVPAYLFIAPREKISVGALEDRTLAFYRSIERSGNVTEAFNLNLKGPMDSFHCQGLFAQVLLGYVKRYCQGRNKKLRQERVLSDALRGLGGSAPNRELLRQYRARVRNGLRPSQAIIDRYSPTFLVGRPAAFTYADLRALISRGRARR